MGVLQDLLDQDDLQYDDPYIKGDGEDNTPSYIREQNALKGKSTANIISEGVDQFGQAVVRDPVGVAKAIGTGIYEGGKEFVQNPVETTSEFVSDVGESIYNVGTKSLADYLPEGVDAEMATEEQMTQARQDRLNDYLNASVVVPAAGVITQGAKLAKAVIPDLDTTAEYFKNIDLEFNPNTLGSNLGNVSLKKVNKNIRNYGMKNVNNLIKAIGDYSTIKTGGGKIRDALLGIKVENGTMVALRPNLNSTIPDNPLGVPDNPFTGKKGETRLTTVHDGQKSTTENPEGSVYSFLPYAVAENVVFKVNQNSRRQIASKIHGLEVADAKNKFPSMSVVGSFNGDRNLLDEGLELVEIGVNPATNHLFVDMSTGHAVKSADAAMTIGDRVYAVGVKYWNAEDAPKAQVASDGTELPNTVKYKYANAAEEAADNNTVPATVEQQTDEMLDTSRRVDTRLPTDPKGGEVDLVGSGTLITDTEALMKGNSKMAENFAMMTQSYPGLRNLWSEDVTETAQNIVSRMTDNIVSLYDMSVRLGIAKDSANWYRGANRIALGLADRFGLEDTKTAGVLAALSPGKDWFQNVAMGERLIKHNAELGPNAPWTAEMDAVSTTVKASSGKKATTSWQDHSQFETVRGRPWGEMETPEQKAMWIRAYDEAHFGSNFREVNPNGDILGVVVTKSGNPSTLVHQSFENMAKAIRILDGDGTLESISPELGKAFKVRNFFNNILNPDSPKDVTVDTHQIAAGLFRPLGQGANEVKQGLVGASNTGDPNRFSNEGAKITGMKGSYGLYFDGTTEAAKLRNVLPREMQSVSWEQLRTLFPKTLKSNKAFVQSVDAIWRMVDDGSLDPEGAREMIIAEAEKMGAGGVPSWKDYIGEKRDVGIATAGLIGAAGLATADEAEEEEGFASPQ